MDITDFLQEQRHIFGTCPHCREVFRLSDARLSYRAKYAPDWLDGLELEEQRLDARIMRFEEREREMRDRAISRARKTVLPGLLSRAVPFFARQGLSPQDAKAVFDPVDFVVFSGLNSGKGLKKVLLLDSKRKRGEVQDSIETAVEKRAVCWSTVKISPHGKIIGD